MKSIQWIIMQVRVRNTQVPRLQIATHKQIHKAKLAIVKYKIANNVPKFVCHLLFLRNKSHRRMNACSIKCPHQMNNCCLSSPYLCSFEFKQSNEIILQHGIKMGTKYTQPCQSKPIKTKCCTYRGATQEFELRSIKFKKYISGLRSIFLFQKKHNFA